ncbi:MAG: hypothetical protein HFI31_01650 [Lachnospiraceae bacterium]|nr:hypothetical protein [Lachnospiraceae bacterium]MCI9132881.1 hypothetical protein [Lachnospiraceae bacterium]
MPQIQAVSPRILLASLHKLMAYDEKHHTELDIQAPDTILALLMSYRFIKL